MDPVTLYAIVTLASSGAPTVVLRQVPADRCEGYVRYFRRKHPTAVVWCRSEIDGGGFISDHLPRKNVVEYVPDRMDMLGMPTGRDAKDSGSRLFGAAGVSLGWGLSFGSLTPPVTTLAVVNSLAE